MLQKKRLMLKHATRGGSAGTWPSPGECSSYVAERGGVLSSANVLSWASSNSTLLSYLYGNADGDVQNGWRAMTAGCRIEPLGCYCFHVAGSMVKAANPHGLKRCAPKDRLMDCSDPAAGPFYIKARRNCSCFAQAPPPASPCLFGDMRPAKLLAIIAACRAARVTHIIEQGRYGGLSAYVYALHGFKVTSIELLPLSEVSAALRALAPDVALVDADGRASVLDLVARAPPSERLAVIFDGEKRQTAYETFSRVKARVALAVFDDTNLDDGAFPQLLRERGEDAWHTWDCAYMRRHNDRAPLASLGETLRAATSSIMSKALRDGSAERMRRQGLVSYDGRLVFHGGMEDLSRFHSSIVRGGAWSSDKHDL